MKKIVTGIVVGSVLLGNVLFAHAQGNNQPTEVSADEIEYNSKTQMTIATGKVVIKRSDGYANADKAHYNVKSEIGQLSGNVFAKYNDKTITCQTLDLMEGKHMLAQGGNVVLTSGKDKLQAAAVEYFDTRKYAQTIGNWAKLTTEDGSNLTATKIIYDMQKGEAVATSNVKINAPARNLVAEGDHGIYLDNTGGREPIFTLTGNAWAIQDGNKISGNKLVFKTDSAQGQATGKVVLFLPPTEKQQTTAKTSVSTQAKQDKA